MFQDKQHSWYTVHSEELAIAVRSRWEGSLSDELSVAMWSAVDAVFCENALCKVSRAGSGREISKTAVGHEGTSILS